jgi:NAD+ diphosphatase
VDDPERVRADGEEVLEVRWFSRQELAEAAASGEIVLSGQISIARALIEHWYGGPLTEA